MLLRRIHVALPLSVSLFAFACAPSSRQLETPSSPEEDPGLQGRVVPPSVLIDDRTLTVDATNHQSKRQALIDYLWGSKGFPSALPTVTRGIVSPLAGLGNLRRVDELDVEMDGGESNVTQHFVAEHSNGRLVVVALGHLCSFADADLDDPTSDSGYGQFRTVDALLKDGYSVLATYMPHMSPKACEDIDHNQVLAKSVTTGHPVKWFVEPVAVSLNYLKTKSVEDEFPRYYDYSMIGMSGGGWTTTLYAAIDQTIRTSIPIAGSVPLHLRSGTSLGDAEQTLPELYSIAGYPDLYVLGASGGGRRQIQVLNRDDSCCFGERPSQYDADAHGPWDQAMRAVETQVDASVHSMGKLGGAFRLEIDEAPNHHTISWNALVATVLAELNGGARSVGADSKANAFLRHRGTLWEWRPEGWVDTALRAVGAPAVITDAANGTELFYRSASNVLTHGFREGGSWKEESLTTTLLSDPVVLRSSTSETLVVGIGKYYRPVLWSLADTTSRVFVDSPRVIGAPALVQGASTLQIYARGLDRQLHLLEATEASSLWSHATLGGTLLGFPAAIHMSDGVDRAYIHDADTYGLREASRSDSSDWQWRPVDAGTALTGSPSASAHGGTVSVRSTTRSGSLQIFDYDGTWSTDLVHSRISGSPMAVGDQVFGTDFGGRLWRYDGVRVERLGRPHANAPVYGSGVLLP